jgi:arylsulfatase A-like enzyme
MNGDSRRVVLLAWLFAFAAFASTFLLVSRRPAAAPQEIVHLCDALAAPDARFTGAWDEPKACDAVEVVRRYRLSAERAAFTLFDETGRRADEGAPEVAAWAPRSLAAANGDPELLRFPTARGGLALVAPMEPGRLLTVTAHVRRGRGSAPLAERVETGQGILFVQPLLSALDLPGELAKRDLITLLEDPAIRIERDSRVLSRTAPADGEWTTLAVALITPDRTAALALQIGAGTGVTGAPFDVDELVVEEATLRRIAGVGGLAPDPALSTLSLARRPAGLPLLPPSEPKRPFVREVDDLLERRDAIVLPPPAQASFEADVPAGDVALEYGVTRVHETRAAWARQRVDVEVEVAPVAGGPVVRQSTALEPGGPDGWIDRRLALATTGGGRLRFKFTTSSAAGSDDVVAIGSPLVRRRSSGDPRKSVVLVSLDTVRVDHLSCEGYPRPTTPNLDALARESAWFRDAASTSSYTLPAHGSLLSGQLPSHHGAESEAAGRSRLWLDRTELLAARLRDAGWQTAAFTGGVFLSAKFGFAQGFDRYDATDLALERRAPRYDRAPVLGQTEFNRAYRRQHALGHALDWIRGHSDGPFFLFLHTYLVHEYLPAARHEARFHAACASAVADEDQHLLRDRGASAQALAADVDHFVDLYDAALNDADEMVGRLLATLRETGELDQTIVVVLSDHGEEFFDHGALSHGRTLYDEMLRVPLIVRVPGAPPSEIRAAVSLVDVMPTLLDACGLDSRQPVDGRSLLPWILGAKPGGSDPPQLAELNLDAANRWIARRQEGFAALDVRDERGVKRLARDRTKPKPPRRMLFGGTRDARQTVDLSADVPLEAVDLVDALSDQRSEMAARREAVRRLDSGPGFEGYFEREEDE